MKQNKEIRYNTGFNLRIVCGDKTFVLLAWFSGIIGLLLPVSIIGFLTFKGCKAISWEFLTQSPAGIPLGSAGGIRPAIKGSLALVTLGLGLALPLGIGGAIYLAEYGRGKKLLAAIRFILECMAAIPAIIYGLFGFAFLVVFLNLKISLLAGGLTLGLVMLPIILIGTEEAFKAVEQEQRETALGLGVTRVYMIRRVIFPQAISGILAAIVLAAGHAFGTAAPVLYTASVVYSQGGLNLRAPVMTLPTHLYQMVSEVNTADSSTFTAAYGTALVLVISLLMTNFFVMLLKNWLRRR